MSVQFRRRLTLHSKVKGAAATGRSQNDMLMRGGRV